MVIAGILKSYVVCISAIAYDAISVNPETLKRGVFEHSSAQYIPSPYTFCFYLLFLLVCLLIGKSIQAIRVNPLIGRLKVLPARDQGGSHRVRNR